MHPDLEDFLEQAFTDIAPTDPAIGRVVVEPDYDAEPEGKDAGHLASELLQCLREVDASVVAGSGHEGYVVETPGAYRVLGKYVRRITLYPDKLEGEWVEVAPPGNWI